MQIKKLLVMLALAGLVARQSRADLMTFDTLPDGEQIPNGYGGLNWNNFESLYGARFPGTGYERGIISPDVIAFNGAAFPARFTGIGGATFQLNSAYLTAAWDSSMQVEVLGTLGGATIFDHIYTVNDSGPTLINFDHAAVDTAIFSSVGGFQFVMDNLNVSVPEPSQFAFGAVTLLGALGFGYRHWRKTDKA